MRTEREQNIEQVAMIMLEHLGLEVWFSFESAWHLNHAGWTFDVRYDYEAYLPSSYSSITCCHLSEADVRAAYMLAEDWHYHNAIVGRSEAIMRTEQRQNIEQVADIIYERGLSSFADARTINRKGWTFEVRYDSHEYPDDRGCTRVEDCILSDDGLRDAWAMVEHWLGVGYR